MKEKQKVEENSLTESVKKLEEKLQGIWNDLTETTGLREKLVTEILKNYKTTGSTISLLTLIDDHEATFVRDSPGTARQVIDNIRPSEGKPQVNGQLRESLASLIATLSRKIVPGTPELSELRQELVSLSNIIGTTGVLDYISFVNVLTLVTKIPWMEIVSDLYIGQLKISIEANNQINQLTQLLKTEFQKGYNQREKEEEDLFKLRLRQETERLLEEHKKDKDELRARLLQDIQTAKELGYAEAFERAYDIISEQEGSYRDLHEAFCDSIKASKAQEDSCNPPDTNSSPQATNTSYPLADTSNVQKEDVLDD